MPLRSVKMAESIQGGGVLQKFQKRFTRSMNTKMHRWGPVSVIPGKNRGRYPYCHSIYIEEAGLLIDPGSDRERLQEIKQNNGFQMIWLSHWHEDHFMHLDVLDDLPLWMSEPDAEPLSDVEIFLNWYGVENEKERAFWRRELKEKFHYRPRTPERFLRDGEIINLGNLTVEVIGTPGHSPGHLAFLFREPQILFLGDYDLTPFGPWYGDRYSSIAQTIASIEMLKEIPAKVWLTGHETGIFEGETKKLFDAYLGVIQSREDKLLDFLNHPRTIEEIADAWIIYGRKREPAELYAFGERANIQKHLETLLAQETIGFEGERYVRIA
jgi:glyoxylase-like metal-dependent hydrolase (beta-lactamase superfamily II)